MPCAAAKVIPSGFTTAQQIMEQRSELIRVTTGCQALNDILGGGLETGSITELFGEYRSGKTQVRVHACLCSVPLLATMPSTHQAARLL